MLEKETPEHQSDGGSDWNPTPLQYFPSLEYFCGNLARLLWANLYVLTTTQHWAKRMIKAQISARYISAIVLFFWGGK